MMLAIDLMALPDQLRAMLSGVGLPVILFGLLGLLVMRSKFAKRVGKVLEDLLFTNWRLGLLSATGIVLSLASGWTTWDGMKNFTGEPILSGMVTFGIQGVMLIVAWLIGESFATGMNQQTANGLQNVKNDISLKVALGITLLAILSAMLALLIQFGGARSFDVKWLYGAAGGLLVVGLIIIASKTNTLRGYFDAMRVMVRSSVLWVMFLACMATSVFFSFDSLFSTIFPQSERVRAAELRAQNQVAGVVADIGSTISKRQLSESEGLFGTDGWKAYDKNLTELARAAASSQGAIEEYFVKQANDRKAAKQNQQEKIATSQSSQAGIAAKQLSMREELARLEAERPGLASAFAEKKAVVEEKQRTFDAKRVEALAEERGVEGTGKIGQGPQYRARKAEQDKVQDEIKIAQERLKDAERPLRAAEARISTIKRELAAVDGDIAKLKAEVQTAEQLIKLSDDNADKDDSPKVDPARILPAFEKLRSEFRQAPKAETLGQVQQMCLQMTSAMSQTPATKDKVRGIDCDPKTASEAAARVFALNDGIKVFGNNCAGGDKLAQYKSADALFEFARKCTQDSGLASKDTDDLRQKINFIELNRDDKANRFVVTWNAFQDGNRLAYLALAIAIAIDSLVFMSGLFGANAVRSPLSDVPSTKARNAEQLEAIIDNALLPHKFENARIAIEAMQADTSAPGYTAVVEMRALDPERQIVVSKVLNAGATIGAVLRDKFDPGRYFVRPELFEYLSMAGTRAFEKNGQMVKENIEEKIKLAELEKNISVALLPERGASSSAELNYHIALGAQVVLDHLHPFPDPDNSGFRSELIMTEIPEASGERKIARRALTAGSNMRLVERAKYVDPVENASHRYVLHSDFVKTLSRLRARMLLSTAPAAAQVGYAGSLDGGALNGSVPALGAPLTPAQSLPAPLSPNNGDHYDHGAQNPASNKGRMSASNYNAPRERPTTLEPVAAAPEFDREMVEHFAREMSQHASTVEYLARHQGDLDVKGLWRALDLVLRHDDAGLRRPILVALKSIDQNVEEARASFPSQLMTASGAAAALNDFADRLKAMQVAMVMLPGGAYDNRINMMEAELSEDAAAGRLTRAKQDKLDLLVQHRSELARAQYAADHWQAVIASLMKLEHGLANLAAADQRPQRLA